MPKKGKQSPEEKKFAEYLNTYTPIFKLFDTDSDGELTQRELMYYLGAIALPTHILETEQIKEYLSKASVKFDIEATVQLQLMIEKYLDTVKHYYERYKCEWYSVVHCEEEEGLKPPVADRKWVKKFLSSGENGINDIEWQEMLLAMNDKGKDKVATAIFEKQMKDEGKSQEEIQAMLNMYKDKQQDFIDFRQLIVHMFSFQFNGQIMSRLLNDKLQKEKQAAKDKAKK